MFGWRKSGSQDSGCDFKQGHLTTKKVGNCMRYLATVLHVHEAHVGHRTSNVFGWSLASIRFTELSSLVGHMEIL